MIINEIYYLILVNIFKLQKVENFYKNKIMKKYLKLRKFILETNGKSFLIIFDFYVFLRQSVSFDSAK